VVVPVPVPVPVPVDVCTTAALYVGSRKLASLTQPNLSSKRVLSVETNTTGIYSSTTIVVVVDAMLCYVVITISSLPSISLTLMLCHHFFILPTAASYICRDREPYSTDRSSVLVVVDVAI